MESIWEHAIQQVPALTLFVATVVILARIQNKFLESMANDWKITIERIIKNWSDQESDRTEKLDNITKTCHAQRQTTHDSTIQILTRVTNSLDRNTEALGGNSEVMRSCIAKLQDSSSD